MTEEELAFSEIIGDLIEQWGFKRHLGRIWSLIYLRYEPTSPAMIQEELQMSAGAVSASLFELQTWGVIKRIRIAGDRSFYYAADLQVWKSIANVLRARELRILEEASAGLEVLATTFEKKSGTESGNHQAKRVKHIHSSVETAFTLFNILVTQNALSLPKIGKLYAKLKSL